MATEYYIIAIDRPRHITVNQTAGFLFGAIQRAMLVQPSPPVYKNVKCRRAIKGRDTIDPYRLVTQPCKAT